MGITSDSYSHHFHNTAADTEILVFYTMKFKINPKEEEGNYHYMVFCFLRGAMFLKSKIILHLVFWARLRESQESKFPKDSLKAKDLKCGLNCGSVISFYITNAKPISVIYWWTHSQMTQKQRVKPTCVCLYVCVYLGMLVSNRRNLAPCFKQAVTVLPLLPW